jgi:orotate phosphoribosyltransferase
MEKIIELLRESGALLEGHFLLSSGRHSDRYFQCAKLLQYPDKAREVFKQTVIKIKDDINSGKLKIDIVAGPAMGGIIAAYEVARQLGLPSIFTERDENGKMTLRRGFEIQKDMSVLIVEDVVTTGKSSLECAATLEAVGGIISALACIVDRRSGDTENIQWPFYPAVKLSAGNWDASVCDLCKKGIPAVKPGSRKTIS